MRTANEAAGQASAADRQTSETPQQASDAASETPGQASDAAEQRPDGETSGPPAVAGERADGDPRADLNGHAGHAPRDPEPDVPRWLNMGAAWTWRLVLLGGALYLLARIAAVLYVVMVPCTAALLLTALLQPLVSRLRRAGLGPMSATWAALLGAIIVMAGVGALVTARVQAEYPTLVPQVKNTSDQVQAWLAGSPFHLRTLNLQSISDNLVKYLSQHRSLVEGTVVTGGKIAAEVLAGLVLMFFVTFFLLKDGDRIWRWLTSGLQPERRQRVNRAGHAAWQGVVHYIRGTVAVAAIHAIAMGITLSVINAPLVAPLALLMFIAAFVPLVGALIAGALAILIVLASKGWLLAVIVLIVLVVMNQLEGHLLQPQVVGKMVHLHPLAVILVLAVGGVLAGIYGAIIAVPITAAVTRALPELRAARPPAARPPDT